MADIWLMRVLIGRYVCKTVGWFGKKVSSSEACRIECGSVEGYEYRDMSVHELSKLERDNADSWVGMYGCMGLVVSVVGVFWCVLFVDMVGDDHSVWVVACVLVVFMSMMGFLTCIVS